MWESSHTTSKRFAERLLAIRQAEVTQSRYDLLKTCPRLKDWAERYLESVQHLNTRKRYACSKNNLVSFFREEAQLVHISAAKISEFKRVRRDVGAKNATINRDLRFLAQILKEAERQRYIARSPFDLNRFFANEAHDRRKALILSFEDQKKLLAHAAPKLRAFIILAVATGMRTSEMLGLRWADIDWSADTLRVEKSKSAAGLRCVPFSAFCKCELLEWRELSQGENSEWVFPNPSDCHNRLQTIRKAWTNALKNAGIVYRPSYYLRHTWASRMTGAGVSPITIAQMLGHSSTQIVGRYCVAVDQNRIDAMNKLEAFTRATVSGGFGAVPETKNLNDELLPGVGLSSQQV